MKILVVLGHPKPGSFNHAIAEVVCETLKSRGHEPVFHDLYSERFDPIMPAWEIDAALEKLPEPIQAYFREIRQARGLVLIHPNWWGGPPAIMRGWLDRVLRNGFAYKFTETGPAKMLDDKIVQIFSTSNTPREIELNVYKDPVEWFWKVLVFGLCGCESFARRNFEPVVASSVDQRHAWLREVGETVTRRFPND